MPLAPSTNSAVPPQSPRSRGRTEAQDTSALPREASSMARLARTSAARNSSVSPARALRRPMRIFWPRGAAEMSSPALRASLIIGLVSGLCIHRAPRSNGTSNVAVSVRQRPPIWPAASTTMTLRFAAWHTPSRGDAGGACADHDNVSLARQWRTPCATAKGRHRRHRRGCRQELAPRHCHVMVSGILKPEGTSSELAASERKRQPSW